MSHRLKADELRASCDPAALPFRSTAELVPLSGLIGQERALDATTFGIGMKNAGYNVFTGSVNQQGEIQPVGGINEKIEGFFDACRRHGLTGAQGVLIPEANVRHLMLREDVAAAVRDEAFHVYAVRTVDEGLAVLSKREMGEPGPDGAYPEGSFNAAVRQALIQNVERLKAMRHAPSLAVPRTGKDGGGDGHER